MTGMRCIRTEQRCGLEQNQWQEVTQYGPLGQPQLERNTAPMKERELMVSGLKLKLRFADETGHEKVAGCALSEYQSKTEQDRIEVILRDVPGCPARFSAHPEEGAHLSLVNEMSEPFRYPQGAQVKSWEDKILQPATEAVYSPGIAFEGMVTWEPGASD